jgi:hypothetical protein
MLMMRLPNIYHCSSALSLYYALEAESLYLRLEILAHVTKFTVDKYFTRLQDGHKGTLRVDNRS